LKKELLLIINNLLLLIITTNKQISCSITRITRHSMPFLPAMH